MATADDVEKAERRMRLTAAAFGEMVDNDQLQTERAADELERRRLAAEDAWQEYRRLVDGD